MARAAPYAALVMDARTGEVLHARNADTRLHPASLTKMMTLYIAFEAVQRGEISLDTMVTISRNAASEPPSKLGLKQGQKIAFRYLIRAAAIKSANDAATAIGEAIEGSEAKFARRMTRTAQALGMPRTTFKNAHGLTESGHLSTARDMTILGRRVLFDYPQYYNLFSRQSESVGRTTVNNTNRKLLRSYRGADGIKTGYTNAAGFNLVASAVRGNERVIATVFGGLTGAWRNARVAELLDMGFNRSPSNAPTSMPATPQYIAEASDVDPTLKGKTIRLVTAPTRSLQPRARPGSAGQSAPVIVAANPPAAATAIVASVASASTANILNAPSGSMVATLTPPPRPEGLVAEANDVMAEAIKLEVVTRVSTSGGRHFGINIGKYQSKYEAESVLLKTALAENGTLESALRKVVSRSGGYEANFVGLTEDMAALACRRLEARRMECSTFGPG